MDTFEIMTCFLIKALKATPRLFLPNGNDNSHDVNVATISFTELQMWKQSHFGLLLGKMDSLLSST